MQRSRRSNSGRISWTRRSRLLKQIAFAKFNETVELSMLLGVDPKHADQMVRGTTVLPHGTGQTEARARDRTGRQTA